LNIQSIKPINIINSTAAIKPKRSPNFRGRLTNASMDAFISSHESLVKSAMAKLNKINIAEYKSLTPAEKQALRREVSAITNLNTKVEILTEDIKLHQYAAESIRQAFDKEFGKGKYVVISIGRSLSSISKLLGAKIGEDNVKNIPLSNLSNINPNGTEQFDIWAKKYCDPQLYKLYLDSIGLSKEKIENSGKEYIILDYAFSGRSLKNAYKILTSDYFWGNKKRNITTVSIQEVLPKTYKKENSILALDLQGSGFKCYSFVNKIQDRNSFNINKATDYNLYCNEKQKEIHKLFGFGLLDSEFETNGARPYKEIDFGMMLANSFPGQNKRFWCDEKQQFDKDFFEDFYELDKALKRNPNSLELKLLKNELENLDSYIKYYVDLKQRIKVAVFKNS